MRLLSFIPSPARRLLPLLALLLLAGSLPPAEPAAAQSPSNPTITGRFVSATQTTARISFTTTNAGSGDSVVLTGLPSTVSISPGSFSLASNSAGTFELSLLTAGQTYNVRVRIRRGSSNIASYPVSFTTRPARITLTTSMGTITSTGAVVRYTASRTGSAARVALTLSPSAGITLPAAKSLASSRTGSFLLTGLTENTRYTATLTVTESPNLNTRATRVFTTQPDPDDPIILTANATGIVYDAANINYTADRTGSTARIALTLSPSAGVTVPASKSLASSRTGSFALTGLSSEITYAVTLTVTETGHDNVVYSVPSFKTPKPPPITLSHTISGRSNTAATINYTASRVGSAAQIALSGLPSSVTTPAAKSLASSRTGSFALTGLSPGTAYSLTLTVTETGYSNVTRPVSFTTTGDPPPPPLTLTASQGAVGSTTATINWTVNRVVTGSYIYLTGVPAGSQPPQQAVTATTGSFSLSGLQPTATYTILLTMTVPSQASVTDTEEITMESSPGDLIRWPADGTKAINVRRTTAQIRYTVSRTGDNAQIALTITPSAGVTLPAAQSLATSRTGTFSLSGLTADTAYAVTLTVTEPGFVRNIFNVAFTTTATNEISFTYARVASLRQTAASITYQVSRIGGTARIALSGLPSSVTTPAAKSLASSRTGTFNLSGLTAGTAYSLTLTVTETGYSNVTRAVSFTTPGVNEPVLTALQNLPLIATAQSLSLRGGFTQSSAEPVTLYYRYRRLGSLPWNGGQTAAAIPNFPLILPFTIAVADPGFYQVQASQDNAFPAGRTFSVEAYTRTRLVTNLTVGSVARTTAALVTVYLNPQRAGGLPLYLRYQASGDTQWTTQTATPIAGATSYTFRVTGLSPGSSYSAQASWDQTFPVYLRRAVQFHTSTAPPPVDSGSIIHSIAVADIHAAGFRLIVQVDSPAYNPVYMRYQAAGANAAWSNTASRVPSCPAGRGCSVEFRLAGLTADTDYAIEVSFNSAFPPAATTVRNQRTQDDDTPRVGAPLVGNISSDTALVTVPILNHDDQTERTVYLQYNVVGQSQLFSDQGRTTGEFQPFTLTGLQAETTYYVRASLTATLPDSDSQSVTFATSAAPETQSAAGTARLYPEPNVDQFAFHQIRTYTLEGAPASFPVILRTNHPGIQFTHQDNPDCSDPPAQTYGQDSTLQPDNQVTLIGCSPDAIGNAILELREKGGDAAVLNRYVLVYMGVPPTPPAPREQPTHQEQDLALTGDEIGLTILLEAVTGAAGVNANPQALTTLIAVLWPIVVGAIAVAGGRKGGLSNPLSGAMFFVVLVLGWTGSAVFLGLPALYPGLAVALAGIAAMAWAVTKVKKAV